MGVIFTILTLLLLSLTIHCQVSRITLNPTTLTLTNNQTYGTVVITCQPPADANIKSLLTMSIKRSTNSIVDQNVGFYEKGDSAPSVNPIINGATITGGGASNSITVTMSQTSCTDAGVYTCDVTFTDPQNLIHSLSSSDNLTVNASPGQILLTPDRIFTTYPNGTSLTLSCNGRIGSEEVQWVWEYKNKDLGAVWTAYVPQSENDISTDPPLSILNSCQRNQVSRLSLVITTDDDGRTYRCYVRRGHFNFDQYAAEYLIQNVGSQGPISATTTSNGPTSAASTSKGPTSAASTSKGPTSAASTSKDQVSRITLNPTTLTLTNNQTYGTVVITCQPPADANIKRLLTLGIKRSTNSIVNQYVGSYDSGDSAPTVGTSISGATITGGGASNSITVTMPQSSCMDAGVYTCDAVYIDPQNNLHLSSSSDNLTVMVNPGTINMTAYPVLPSYDNGTRLTLTCSGLIGSEEVKWVWEYKKGIDVMWLAYKPQSEEDISTDLPSSINICQKTQISRLSHTITVDDDGRRYRCYVRHSSYNFDQYAAEYLINLKISDTDHLNNFSSGLAIGIGCTLAVVIIIIIAALVWMWRLGWVLPCAKTVTKKPENSERTFSHMVNYGLAEESQIYISQGLAGNDGTYDELKTCEIGQAAPYSKWQSTESK